MSNNIGHFVSVDKMKTRDPISLIDAALAACNITTDILGAIVHQMMSMQPQGVLILDYASPGMADALRERGIHFLDGAGNAFLQLSGLIIWIKGERKPKSIAEMESLGRAFQPGGLCSHASPQAPDGAFSGRYT